MGLCEIIEILIILIIHLNHLMLGVLLLPGEQKWSLLLLVSKLSIVEVDILAEAVVEQGLY